MIVLVGVGSKYIHQNLAPWYLLAGLEQYNNNLPSKVIELNINQPIYDSLKHIYINNPKLIGFSCYIWNIEYIEKLIKAIKLILPEVIIVCGGPEVSYRAENFLITNKEVDFIISGEGEYAFNLLTRYIFKKSNLQLYDIPGLSYRHEERILHNPIKPLPKPAPSPYCEKCLKSIKGRIAYVETSRGCPFSCSYCLSGADNTTDFFDMDKSKADLILAANSGSKTIKLVDRTFNCNRKRTNELLTFLLDSYNQNKIPKDICFHFEVGADLFNKETLDLLSSAPVGYFQIEAGIQSFNLDTLIACKRKTNLDKLEDNLNQLISKGNIHVHVDLIAGLPLEDFATFKGSFARAIKLKPHMLQLGFLKLLHGSALREESKKHGYRYTPFPPYEILSNNYLSFEDIIKLKTAEKGLSYFYNKGHFPRTIDFLLEKFSEDPLTLFEILGEQINNLGGKISFERASQLLLKNFKDNNYISENEFRDILITDILSKNGTGHIPKFLKNDIEDFRKINSAIRRRYPKGSKLGITLLEKEIKGEKTALVVNYSLSPHRVTGLYGLEYISLKDIL